MRYFRLFDDISGPEGDTYRWDGKMFQMFSAVGEWREGYEEDDAPAHLDQLVASAKNHGHPAKWEEIEVP